MKIPYKIKPFVKDPKLDAIDKEKKIVEDIMGKKFESDYSWENYKKITRISHK